MIERQELHCHTCDKYVQFNLDLSIDGNHVLECPNCGHEHCRVVKKGIITDDKWGQRNGPTIYITSTLTTYTIISVDTSSTSTYTVSWLNTGATY